MQTTSRESVYDTVTAAIVAGLEAAQAWNKPWTDSLASVAPINTHGKAYRGINTLLLAAVSLERGYSSRRWGTYKAWQEKGGQVRKGQKSAPAVFWKSYEREDDEDEKPRRILVAREYRVFNADQVDGAGEEPIILPTTDLQPTLDAFIAREHVALSHAGDRAFYSISADAIRMPRPEQFNNPTTYAATLAHECAHATGHKNRLDRQFGARFGDDAYAIEELTAALASAFLGAGAGLDTIANNTAYLASWLRTARKDSRAVFTVASAAQKAADLIIGPRLSDLEPTATDTPADDTTSRIPNVEPEPTAAPQTRHQGILALA